LQNELVEYVCKDVAATGYLYRVGTTGAAVVAAAAAKQMGRDKNEKEKKIKNRGKSGPNCEAGT